MLKYPDLLGKCEMNKRHIELIEVFFLAGIRKGGREAYDNIKDLVGLGRDNDYNS